MWGAPPGRVVGCSFVASQGPGHSLPPACRTTEAAAGTTTWCVVPPCACFSVPAWPRADQCRPVPRCSSSFADPPAPPRLSTERTYTVFRLNNVARLAQVDDLLHVLRASGLQQCTAADVALNYDAQLRPLRWYLRLPARGAAAAARELNAALAQHVFGGRLLRLEPLPPPHDDWLDLPPAPEQVAGYAGRAVLVSGMTDGTTARDLELFFSDYSLADDPLRMLGRHGPEVQAGRSQMAVVRFTHHLDALRAVQEKHRDLLNSAQVEVNLLQ